MMNRLIASRSSRTATQVAALAIAAGATVLLANDSGGWRWVGASCLAVLLMFTLKLALMAAIGNRNAAAAFDNLRALSERTTASVDGLAGMLAKLTAETERTTASIDQLAGKIAELSAETNDQRTQLVEARSHSEANLRSITTIRTGLDTATTRIDALDPLGAEIEAVRNDLHALAGRTPPDDDGIALLVRRAEPAIAEVAVLISEMMELREAVQRLDRRISR